MSYQLGIPAALAAFGLKVELVPGWENRGGVVFDPEGVMDHWTAGPRGTTSRPSLNICVGGRSGLPGPLCNIYFARDATCVVVAAGRPNHAGDGKWRGLVGNSKFFGIEAESAGNDDWTDLQRLWYPVLNAALLTLTKSKDVNNVCGHNEYAPTRKIDIRDWPMPLMRQQTAEALRIGGLTPTLNIAGDDPMRTVQRKLTQAIYTFGPQQVKHETDVNSAQIVRNVQADREAPFIVADEKGITALCESYGVPWSAVEDVTAGRAFHLDGTRPAKGASTGRFWSALFEMQSKLGVVSPAPAQPVPELDTQALTDTILAEAGNRLKEK